MTNSSDAGLPPERDSSQGLINVRQFVGRVYSRADWPAGFLHVELNGSTYVLRSAHELWYLLQHYHQTGELQLPIPRLPPAKRLASRAYELEAQAAWLESNPGKARRTPPKPPSVVDRLKEIEDLLR